MEELGAFRKKAAGVKVNKGQGWLLVGRRKFPLRFLGIYVRLAD